MRSTLTAVVLFLAICPAVGWSQETLFVDGFDGGYPCGWSYVNPAAACPPEFEGLVLAVGTGQDEMTLAWVPAVDDATPTSEILYRVHLGDSAGFEPTPQTLVTTVVGGGQVVLQGVASGAAYSALVIAEDGDGLQSTERRYMTAATQSVPTILSGTTPLENALDLDLGSATPDGPDLVFQRGPDTQAPTVGAILIGPLVGGGGFLRTVDTVTVTSSEVRVATSPGSLEDAVEQTHLASAGSIPDPDGAVAKQAALWSVDGPVAPVDIVMLRHTETDGSRHSGVAWGDRLLSLATVRHAGMGDGFVYRPGETAGSVEGSFKVGDVGQITLSADLDFRPELITNAIWTVGGIQQAEVIARGTLSLDAQARYEWSAAASYQRTIPIFTTSWVAVYSVGPVPVFQKITLAVEAELTATASAAVTAEAFANATSVVEVGVRYDQANGWQPVTDLAFSRSLRADLEVVGGVFGEIRIIPRLEVEFYEAVAAWITIEPSLSGTIEAEGTLMPTCAPIQLTRFDFNLDLEANVGVDLTLLGSYPLFESTIWDPTPWVLFNLPQVSLDASGVGPVTLTATVTDGVNDVFDPASAMWSVLPGTATITPDPGNPLHATLECSETEIHTATFSGHGVLGPLARRCTQVDVPCTASAGEITVYLPGGVPLTLIHVPAGTFMMGSPADERGRWVGEDLHQVTLTQGYYLGKYEVTQGQWQAVMGTPMPTECGALGVGPDYPVTCVSWNEVCGGSTWSECLAESFVGRVNAHMVDTRFRLPTEAEWERAVRAGTQTRFSHGDVLECSDGCPACATHDQYMWWCGNDNGSSEPVGSKLPNGMGLYDMHGNVHEWVADWWQFSLGTEPQTDPTGPATGSERGFRGGGWTYLAGDCRAAYRLSRTAGNRNFYIGFRLARAQ